MAPRTIAWSSAINVLHLITLAILLPGTGLAQPDAPVDALELTPGQPARGIASYVEYLLSDAMPLGEIERVAALPASAFNALPGGQINFGFTNRTIWVTFEVENTSPDAGRWRLSTNGIYASELGIWQQRQREVVTLLASSRDDSFYDRPVRHRLLAADFELGPREHARMLVGLRRTGASELTLRIDSEKSFAANDYRANAANAAVYAVIAFAALLALVQLAMLRSRMHLVYLLYIASVTLYLAQTDGLAFQYLWPSFGRWNEFAALPIGLFNGIAASLFARTFLSSRSALPRIDRLLLALIAVSAVAALGGLALSESFFKRAAIWISMSITLLCILGGILAYRRGQKSVRFYLAGWAGVAIATIAWAVINSAHSGLDFELGQYATKAGVLFDLLMFLMAMADRAREVRIERDAKLRVELHVLRRQQDLDVRLLMTEESLLKASVLAEQHARQLAEATHDIRQPLASLKLTVARIANEGQLGAAALERLAERVERLDTLARDAAATMNPRPASGASMHEHDRARHSGGAAYPVQLVLDNLELMFRDDAAAKGFRFRCRPSSAVADGEAMTAVRIAGELLAAVIAKREGGSLLIGCRRHANTPHILIGFSRVPAGEPGRASAELAAELGHELAAVRVAAGTVVWSLDLKRAAERATRAPSVGAA